MHNFVIYAFAVLYFCGVSSSLIDISPCARWNPHGITVAGTGIVGNASTQLTTPKGIFLMKSTNTLYVADFGNERVQMFSLNKPSRKAKTVVSNVNAPSKIYVDDDKNGPIIYISVFIGNRVEKWRQGASKGIQLGGECRSCFGVAVDSKKNVYMSELDRFRVVKWSSQTNLTTLVAGQTDVRGTTNKYLSSPNGIYFDQSSETLYVADSGNNRIEKWKSGASFGIQIAGSNLSTPGSDNGTLAQPNAVWVDQKTKVIYVADTLNHRIVRWLPNAIVGDVIAGGRGWGNATDQFNTPTDVAFDSKGNLYVCDNWNHRIQLFSIIDNKPCSSTSTANEQ